MFPKSKTPCRICNGQGKRPCCICGWKGKKEAKEKKEITREDRRSDFLGDIFNWMQKCGMKNTGMIGNVDDEIVIIVEDNGPTIQILDFAGYWIVNRELVERIRPNDLDRKVFEKFGNPLSPDAKPYKRLYKQRKNEV